MRNAILGNNFKFSFGTLLFSRFFPAFPLVVMKTASSGDVYNWEKTVQFKQPRQKPIVLQLKVDRCNKLINRHKITKMEYNKKKTIEIS